MQPKWREWSQKLGSVGHLAWVQDCFQVQKALEAGEMVYWPATRLIKVVLLIMVLRDTNSQGCPNYICTVGVTR